MTIEHIDDLLKRALDKNASDLHLKAGVPPFYRILRSLQFEKTAQPLTGEDIMRFFRQITTETQERSFEKNWELDFSYTAKDLARFRVNAFYQSGTISMVFRAITSKIPSIDELGLPEICKELALKREGLIILTGPTGCGKSTTLAAMLDHMNRHARRNIVTIEDPIEFLHEDGLCTFSQREVGLDTHSFAEALKHAFRQDPDVILIGEMRDLESMAIALTAAESGHLILTTLHTPSSYEAIDRFVDAFPADHHSQVRLQLSTTLQAVLYQSLVPVADKTGVVPAVEVLVATSAIRNLIREAKSYQMINFVHSGQNEGMQTLDQALMDLHHAGKISREDALTRLRSPERYKPE
jgi:twitching motility protein PilT